MYICVCAYKGVWVERSVMYTHAFTHITSLLTVCINSTHTDRATSYFFTKALLELPLLLVQTIMQFFVLYSMIKLQVPY